MYICTFLADYDAESVGIELELSKIMPKCFPEHNWTCQYRIMYGHTYCKHFRKKADFVFNHSLLATSRWRACFSTTRHRVCTRPIRPRCLCTLGRATLTVCCCRSCEKLHVYVVTMPRNLPRNLHMCEIIWL